MPPLFQYSGAGAMLRPADGRNACCFPLYVLSGQALAMHECVQYIRMRDEQVR